MPAALTSLHWLFLFWVAVVILVMGFRKDPLIPCVLGLFTVGWAFTGGPLGGIRTLFSALLVAGSEFWSIIVVIALIVALSKLLTESGADYLVMSPAARVMVNPSVAFWVLGGAMLVASWFFWPSPATALIGAIMVPVAVRAGLPIMGAAVAMNLFGHGIALSTDYVIQGAPTITAKAAGLAPSDVMSASVPLAITMGLVTTLCAFLIMRRDLRRDLGRNGEAARAAAAEHVRPTIDRVSWFLAVVTPVAFVADVAAMLILKLRGGDATALLGGTAVLILAVGSLLKHGVEGLERMTDYVRDGFMFGTKIFAPVIVIAGFFFMGKGELAQEILGKHATGFLEDVGLVIAQAVPLNKVVVAVLSLGTGITVGLDGSGFSPLPLVGSVTATFGKALPVGKSTVAALGQIGGVWTGGGTIIPWGLIPVAAITGVNPIDLARKNMIPVILGFIVTTAVAIVLM